MSDDINGGQTAAPEAVTRWLDSEETEAWIGVAGLLLMLPGVLDAQLQRDSRLTLFDYFILSTLSVAPQRSLRMSELALLANGSLSRLSNAVKRLEERDLVRREPDPSDGRFTTATLTGPGYALLEAAAPGHVETVRRYVIDPLTRTQLRSLRDIGTRIRKRIDPTTDRLRPRR